MDENELPVTRAEMIAFNDELYSAYVERQREMLTNLLVDLNGQITLREHCSIAAMQGLISHFNGPQIVGAESTYQAHARAAVAYADALLAALTEEAK